MTHDARAVANGLIDRAAREGKRYTPLQIIKLVYFCHGWMLGLYERPLVRQRVQAWLYGPVVVDVYRGLKRYGGEPVARRMSVADEDFDELEEDLVDQVHEKYGSLSGRELSRLTHAVGTPWHQVWYGKGRNSIIPNFLIQEHYAEKARITL